MGQRHKRFREFWTPFPLRDIRENPRSNVRACAAGDGPIWSKDRKIVPYHGANPNTRNGTRVRSPSLIMSPDRSLWKNENSVYRLQISAVVPEIFQFETCVKYANEMTEDVIHSTQYYYIMNVNKAIFANLQRRTFKLGMLIVLQKTHLRL